MRSTAGQVIDEVSSRSRAGLFIDEVMSKSSF